jgi:hypothetical protein
VGEIESSKATEEQLGLWMAGITDKQPSEDSAAGRAGAKASTGSIGMKDVSHE